jgi:transposase
MLDQGTRAAILKLRQQGHSVRAIARILNVSRGAVREVLRSGTAEVPVLERPEKALPHRDQIVELYRLCRGNLVRVHEELAARGIALSYPALTAFCRRHEIGRKPAKPVGEYAFRPGQEMQHDTSPHRITIDGRERRAQTASLVLCHSRLLFFQFYPRFTRFECKLFLTDALQYVGGACEMCMIDNTHVVVLKGTGAGMVPVPEMKAFADRYDFKFLAHEKGDANRSARVERRFSYIENNFLANRRFADWGDANRQARAWCDQVNATFRRKLKGSPRDLFAAELPYLKQLPVWVPPVYRLHPRLVDTEGYVAVHTNRYSVPDDFIGLAVEARETRDSIEIYRGPRLIARHPRAIDTVDRKYRLPEHRRPRGQRTKAQSAPEETRLLAWTPEIASYVEGLKQRAGGRATLALRRLLRLVEDYPREAVLAALGQAAQYGLYDLERVETMILRRLAGEYFLITPPWEDDDE